MEAEKHVAVIGAGCAGLAAAATLAEQGIAVTLFESSPTLGGRARGVPYKGLKLDNGQHIFLGAYSSTLRLLKLANVSEHASLLRIPLQLSMLNLDKKKQFCLRAATCLPAPLHILAGLLFAKGLSWRERLAAIRFMLWMKLAGFRLAQDETLHTLLVRKNQPARLIKLLWEPLCLAALNTPLANASAQVYLNVLRDSFSKSKSDSDMLLPRYDLSELMAEPLCTYIQGKGGLVRSGAPVAKVHKSDSGFALELANSMEVFSHVILAVSPFRLPDIAGNLPDMTHAIRLAEAFQYQPIYTVYLQYPDWIKLDLPLAGFDLSDYPGYGQWVFDRGLLYGQHGLLAVVISAEGTHQKLTQENLAEAVAGELSLHFPHLPPPRWHKVIAEKRATFACTPGLQRPPQTTPIQGLYLSGDYTAGDYPATIEGAVRSGIQCANLVASEINSESYP